VHGELQPNEPILIGQMRAEAAVEAACVTAWNAVTPPKPGRRRKGNTPKDWAQRILLRAETEMRRNDVIVDQMMPEVFKAVLRDSIERKRAEGKAAA
jgi:hypothetical protein